VVDGGGTGVRNAPAQAFRSAHGSGPASSNAGPTRNRNPSPGMSLDERLRTLPASAAQRQRLRQKRPKPRAAKPILLFAPTSREEKHPRSNCTRPARVSRHDRARRTPSKKDGPTLRGIAQQAQYLRSTGRRWISSLPTSWSPSIRSGAARPPNDGTLGSRPLSFPSTTPRPDRRGWFAHLTCPQQGDGQGFLQPKVDCGFERLPGYKLCMFDSREWKYNNCYHLQPRIGASGAGPVGENSQCRSESWSSLM
jgi:hypothetical protein